LNVGGATIVGGRRGEEGGATAVPAELHAPTCKLSEPARGELTVPRGRGLLATLLRREMTEGDSSARGDGYDHFGGCAAAVHRFAVKETFPPERKTPNAAMREAVAAVDEMVSTEG